jgi:hypothetical protein
VFVHELLGNGELNIYVSIHDKSIELGVIQYRKMFCIFSQCKKKGSNGFELRRVIFLITTTTKVGCNLLA